MKTILIATDFSPSAKNAADYVSALFEGKECKFLLYHSYHIPLPVAHEPILVNFEDLGTDSMKNLETEKERLKKRTAADITCITDSGFAVDNLIGAENEYHPDLIVMGMEPTGSLSEHLLGSITTSFITRTAAPVLIVPLESAFSPLNSVAFACDYDIDPNGEVLKGLKEFIKYFHLKLLILNFMKKEDLLDTDKAVAGIVIDNYFEDTDHSYYFMEEEDFVEGMKKFVKEHDAGIIALIPHKHSFLFSLFKESHTKKLAFHSSLPILAFPERLKAK